MTGYAGLEKRCSAYSTEVHKLKKQNKTKQQKIMQYKNEKDASENKKKMVFSYYR